MIYLGIGSNLRGPSGNPKDANLRAIYLLNKMGIKVLFSSSLWRSTPIPFSSVPCFVNSVVACDGFIGSSLDLMKKLNKIELIMGKKYKGINKPRTIDLDILDFKGEITIEGIVLPHPRIHLRRFVLEPLFQVAPNWRHPIYSIKVMQMLTRVRKKQNIFKIE